MLQTGISAGQYDENRSQIFKPSEGQYALCYKVGCSEIYLLFWKNKNLPNE